MNAPRSGCPINVTLEALGDRWSLIVIRDLMFRQPPSLPRVADPVGAMAAIRDEIRSRPAACADVATALGIRMQIDVILRHVTAIRWLPASLRERA
jgi:hypothetical protein